jgi:hypothetical protein
MRFGQMAVWELLACEQAEVDYMQCLVLLGLPPVGCRIQCLGVLVGIIQREMTGGTECHGWNPLAVHKRHCQ